MKDQKKATFWNMSFSSSPRCYGIVVENGGNLRLVIKSTNDDADSALGVCTQNIQCDNYVAISSAAALSDATRNHVFDRSIAPTNIVNSGEQEI